MNTNNQIGILCAIFTYNEERRIKSVIDSAKTIADEILIVDNNSSDATCDIANKNGAKIIKHSFPPNEYKNRIKLVFDYAASCPDVEFVTHLNCSERFLISKSDVYNYLSSGSDALACYRKSLTDGVPTHPYHIVYIYRSLFDSHHSFRFIRKTMWDESKCEIHREWQPYEHSKTTALPVWITVVQQFRDGDITVNEQKHLLYAKEEASSKGPQSLWLGMIRILFKNLFYIANNLPYLITNPNKTYILSIIQHIRYYSLVEILRIKDG
jgi:glycosyltransferase involved in cell wall biosynthesis